MVIVGNGRFVIFWRGKYSYHQPVENEPSPPAIVDVTIWDRGIGGYVKKRMLIISPQKKYFYETTLSKQIRVASVFTSILFPEYSTISHPSFLVISPMFYWKSRVGNYFIAIPYRRSRLSNIGWTSPPISTGGGIAVKPRDYWVNSIEG
jgi:hypothetical protein